MKCKKLHRTLIIVVPNGVIMLNCYKEKNLHELIKHFLKIKAIEFHSFFCIIMHVKELNTSTGCCHDKRPVLILE